MDDNMNVKEYGDHYSEDKLFDKILKYAKSAGIKVVYACLLLFYALKKPDLPVKARGTIIGALGYFIFPMDLISDMILGIGYTDDVAVLIGALVVTAFYIDEEVRNKAKAKLRDLFGDYDDNELKEVDDKIDKSKKDDREPEVNV